MQRMTDNRLKVTCQWVPARKKEKRQAEKNAKVNEAVQRSEKAT